MLPEELVLIIVSYLNSPRDFERFNEVLRIFKFQSSFPFAGKLFAHNFPIFFDKIIKLRVFIPDWTSFYFDALRILDDIIRC